MWMTSTMSSEYMVPY